MHSGREEGSGAGADCLIDKWMTVSVSVSSHSHCSQTVQSLQRVLPALGHYLHSGREEGREGVVQGLIV